MATTKQEQHMNKSICRPQRRVIVHIDELEVR